MKTMKTLTTLTVLGAVLTGLSFGGTVLAQPQPGSTIIVSSLHVRARTYEAYWKGKDKAFDHWSWLPEIKAQVTGPLSASAQILADFSKPDGKPWLTLDMKNSYSRLAPLENGEAAFLENMSHTPAQEKMALNEGGNVNFQIRRVDNGSTTVLYKGRMKVVKAHSGIPGDNFKNQYLFYNDYDWLANVGYLSQDQITDPKSPNVELYTWHKGAGQDNTYIKGYLYYQGKQIANTESSSTGFAYDVMSIMPSVQIRDKDDQNTWRLWRFTFSRVYGFWSHDPGSSATLPEGGHILANNPGDYEFKVLRKGQLVRTGKFTIKPDGYANVPDWYEPHYDIASGMEKVGPDKANVWMFIPITAQGTADGAWNPNSYKTEKFWGN